MALLGNAALAMWWDMAPARREEFEHWHTHEHFHERLALGGFLRATRWRSADGGEGFFQIYELAEHAVLASPGYLARLNAPTPWSTRLMPEHRNMLRSQCHVLASSGCAVAGHALTVRLSPAPGAEARLHEALAALGRALIERPGLVGAHLLRHEAPAIGTTTEQKIRGGDGFADWVWLVVGYDRAVLEAVAAQDAGDAALQALGALPGAQAGLYHLSHTALPAEWADGVPISRG